MGSLNREEAIQFISAGFDRLNADNGGELYKSIDEAINDDPEKEHVSFRGLLQVLPDSDLEDFIQIVNDYNDPLMSVE